MSLRGISPERLTGSELGEVLRDSQETSYEHPGAIPMSDQKVIAKDDPHIKRSRQYQYYLRRLFAGFCGTGGCPEKLVTKQYCRRHADLDLVRRKKKRSDRKNGTVSNVENP